MRTGTIFRQYELFVAAGVLAAHATASSNGYRQRDVRFLIELFSNWVESSFEGEVLPISNTQVLRYLEQLVQDGFARRRSVSKIPHYSLTRSGLIELLGRLFPQALSIQPEQFFFLFYFLKNYRPLLWRLVESEGKKFPLALRYEVESLLDVTSLVEQQVRFAELELRRIEERIAEGFAAGKLAKEKLKTHPLEAVAAEIEQLYPYELNSQRPLTDFISAIPEALGAWELSEGSLARAEVLWKPAREMLVVYVEQLRYLLEK